jgi:hypothetical protein
LVREELRARLRGRRVWLPPLLYAAVQSVKPWTLLAHWRPTLAHELTQSAAVVQCLALLFLGPVVGAAAGNGVRPGPRRMLAALAAATLYCLYVMAAALPVFAMAFLLGPPDWTGLLGLYTTQALVALTLASFGLAAATICPRAWQAKLAATGVTLILAIATFANYARLQTHDALAFLTPNPLLGTFLAVEPEAPTDATTWLVHWGSLLLMTALAVAVARVKGPRRMPGATD